MLKKGDEVVNLTSESHDSNRSNESAAQRERKKERSNREH